VKWCNLWGFNEQSEAIKPFNRKIYGGIIDKLPGKLGGTGVGLTRPLCASLFI